MPEHPGGSPTEAWIQQALRALPARRRHLEEALNESIVKWSLATACLIMLGTLAWHYQSSQEALTENVAVANSVIHLSLKP